MFDPSLLAQIRSRFAHVDECPIAGPRVFFENAGGALTLHSVVQTSARMAAIPDNQGRDNPASHELVRLINEAKADMRVFFNAKEGQVFVGESGTELLFRLIRTAIVGCDTGGEILGSTLEHPASRSACEYWAKVTGRPYRLVAHDNTTGSVSVDDYRPLITPATRVATILHTSPVTGMAVDVGAIAAAIRQVSPQCYIIVDGIQHAAHGGLDIDSYGIDGYAISPYKVFSRHGYGVAWASPRLCALPHERLSGSPDSQWELGTRDTGAYATFSDVVRYFDWLGAHFTDSGDRRARIVAAGQAIKAHEAGLVRAMVHGTGGEPGLVNLPGVGLIGGPDNPLREGLVSLTVRNRSAADVVSALREQGIRTHERKSDLYSANILEPLGLPACVRVSLCHYNSVDEVGHFLRAMHSIVATTGVPA